MLFLQERFDGVKMFIGKKAEHRCTPQKFAVLYFHSTETGTLSRGCVYLVVSNEKYWSSSRWSTRDLTIGSSSRGSTFLMIRQTSNPSPCGIGSRRASFDTHMYFCFMSPGRASKKNPPRQSAYLPYVATSSIDIPSSRTQKSASCAASCDSNSITSISNRVRRHRRAINSRWRASGNSIVSQCAPYAASLASISFNHCESRSNSS